MAKRDKYNPDYEKLYPEVEITPEITEILKQSDRKMRYLEVDIKRGIFRHDPDAKKAEFTPTREDSLDRLLDDEKMDFFSEDPSPEEAVVHNDEINRLCRALTLLKPEEYALIHAVFFEEITEKTLANQFGLTQQGISWRLQRILDRIKKLMES